MNKVKIIVLNRRWLLEEVLRHVNKSFRIGTYYAEVVYGGEVVSSYNTGYQEITGEMTDEETEQFREYIKQHGWGRAYYREVSINGEKIR